MTHHRPKTTRTMNHAGLIRISKLAIDRAAPARPPGYIDDVRQHIVEESDTHIWISSAAYDALVAKYSSSVGTELRKLLSWFPIPKKHGCRSCRTLEGRMNRWGPDKCEEYMDYILRRLKRAAKRRGLPFSRWAAKKIVMRAISKARKTQT